ncbi:MAG: uncharacterized protein QOD40_1394 [Alphaproteobacteria bacterium]|jgi:hypothetical protein|nr:uncharacterized protein [Alphaproteobacteria bacterium]
MVHRERGLVRAAIVALALMCLAGTAQAQAQAPSAAAIATARELITAKGAADMFDSMLPGVVERVKINFLQTNPNLGKELNEVSAKLVTDLNPRLVALKDDVVKLYASQFTEQELKEALAFYKSPLGQKIIANEPKILDQSVVAADQWASKLTDEVMTRIRIEMKKKGHDL